MKSIIFRSTVIITVTSFLIFSCTGAKSSSEIIKKDMAPSLSIMPYPVALQWLDGTYKIPKENIICSNSGSETAVQWLQELLRKAGIKSALKSGNFCGNWNLITDPGLKEKLGDEGYTLDINEKGVAIKAATQAGLFYGIQSLRQLFPAEVEQGKIVSDEIHLQKVAIEDKPQYSWRGTMVDVARSFFGKDYLKQHVDRMSLYKLNRLHLHLSDDQGWRIEIKSRPLLTEKGSLGAVENGRSGFLTQEDYLELQQYASARNIIIIPEIDMPGHIYAALSAYPELNCDEYKNLTPKRVSPPEPFRGHEVGWSKFCLEKPEVYNFVSDVIGELAEITTGPWIHIGGDEIDDPRYNEFVVKADSIVKSNNKISIGWEEVTQANVSPTLISQQWHGKVKSVVDVKVIQSICSNFYLDHANVPGQEKTNNWCKETGVSLEDVYSFKNNNSNTIGIEAPVWTEHVWTDAELDDRFWPRILAVAEVAWTPQDQRNFQDFQQRLAQQGKRMNTMGINYFRTPEIKWPTSQLSNKPTGVFSGFLPDSEITVKNK